MEHYNHALDHMSAFITVETMILHPFYNFIKDDLNVNSIENHLNNIRVSRNVCHDRNSIENNFNTVEKKARKKRLILCTSNQSGEKFVVFKVLSNLLPQTRKCPENRQQITQTHSLLILIKSKTGGGEICRFRKKKIF